MKKIKFLMGLHCHQPVDNFGQIFEEAYRKAYEPFLATLERHPGIKLSLHYSGPVIDWFLKNRQGFIERIIKLVDKGQVEILSGGYYEPIVPMIPERDALGQMEMLTSFIETKLHRKPTGFWLTERIWDPSIRDVLKKTDMKYTIVDDFHFKCAGVKENKIFGHYSVKGIENFSVFASVKKLRYAMPFRPVSSTMDYIKGVYEKEGAQSVTFADDCEKFGLWPYTHDWVYRKGWLDKLFTELEKSDFIETATFSEALEKDKSLGEIEVPSSSYEEMFNWSGGDFNNFFKKYSESDLMRRRMLHLSEKLSTTSEKEARNELYKAQSNCAYWHGVFGGVYLTHLRQGIYSHMIKAERAIDKKNGKCKIEKADLRGEYKNSICLKNDNIAVFINPDYAGAIFEIDYKPTPYNLVNTISRRFETYHRKLIKNRKLNVGKLKKDADKDDAVDLYDVLGVRGRNLRRFLSYDSYNRFSFMCHVMKSSASLKDFMKSDHVDTSENSLFGPFKQSVEDKKDGIAVCMERNGEIKTREGSCALKLKKCVIVEKGSEIFIKLFLKNVSDKKVEIIFGVEFNWSVRDESFMRPKRIRNVKNMTIKDRYSNLKINYFFEKPMGLWSFPVYTLNESERGLDKGFQEISQIFYKKLVMKQGSEFLLEGKINISV